jgi:hypothetical protein
MAEATPRDLDEDLSHPGLTPRALGEHERLTGLDETP